jgi:hypothetical protein
MCFLDLSKERRIEKLKKDENKLYEDITRGSPISLEALKDKLAVVTGSYHKIQAIGYVRKYIAFLLDKSILLEKSLQHPASLPQELTNIIKTIAWALVKLNFEQAPEFHQMFKPFIGDLSKIDNQVDRQVHIN